MRSFMDGVNGDEGLRGKFSYIVSRVEDGPGRVHMGRWIDDETLEHLKSQPFFGEFGATVKGFAGDSLQVTDLIPFAETHPLEAS